jgi:hypothetical protein
MGADLYLKGEFERHHKPWKELFDKAVGERDKCETDSTQFRTWQRRVETYYERMYAVGYFRDPYNDWEMLGLLDLSWDGDVIPMLDLDHHLSPAKAKEFLTLLESREAKFKKNLTHLSRRDSQYFREQYRKLNLILQHSVAANLPIYCSL